MKRLIKELRSIFEKNNIETKLENHNKEMLNANFWQDKANSKKILKEKKLFEDLVQSYQQSIKKCEDIDDREYLLCTGLFDDHDKDLEFYKDLLEKHITKKMIFGC